MNLEGIRTRLEDLYGPAATDESTYYDRIINDAYKDLCSITPWWFLEKQSVITTTGIADTFEVEATNGDDDLVPSSSAEWIDDYDGGWLSSGEHVYRILDADDSTGDINLDSAWIEADDAAASVNVWKDIFSLPSDFSDIVSVIPRSFPGKKPLLQIQPEAIEAETVQIHSHATEHAHKYCIFRETDKDTYYKIRIYPPPSEEVEYLIKYISLPEDLTDSSDESLLPMKYHTVLSDLSKLKLVKDRREDPDIIQSCEMEAQKGLARLWKAQKRSSRENIVFGRRGAKKAQYMPFKPVNVNSDSP